MFAMDSAKEKRSAYKHERRAYLGVHLHELDFGNFDGVVVLVFLFFFFLGRFDFFHDEFERIVVERQLS